MSNQAARAGVEVSLPEFGVERKLLAFIEDESKPVDKTTWLSLTGWTLKPAAQR